MHSYFAQKRVLVTGASSGIGWALSLELARRGAHLIALGRNRERLSALEAEWKRARRHPEQSFESHALDLRDSQALKNWVTAHAERPLDMMIQNAGVGYPDYLTSIPEERLEELLQTNLVAPVRFTRLLLPGFEKRKAGHIAFVGSIAGEVNLVGFTAYGATKAGLFAFADSLRNEMRLHNVRVSVIHPPDTKTPMYEAELKVRPPLVQKLAAAGGALDADRVARALLDGMAKGRFRIFPDAISWLLYQAFRLLPHTMRWYLDWQVRKARARSH